MPNKLLTEAELGAEIGKALKKSGAGRPTKYKPEFADIARRLCVMGFTDDAVAVVLDVSPCELAGWAAEHPDFLAAMSPPQEAIDAYRAKVAARSAARSAQRKAASTPSKRVRDAMASRMWAALKAQGVGKGASFFDLVGYSKPELIFHLESQFAGGMTWENYGDWHVDHKKPCALFDLTDQVQLQECWALSNLQPLWATDNIRKGAKYAGA